MTDTNSNSHHFHAGAKLDYLVLAFVFVWLAAMAIVWPLVGDRCRDECRRGLEFFSICIYSSRASSAASRSLVTDSSCSVSVWITRASSRSSKIVLNVVLHAACKMSKFWKLSCEVVVLRSVVAADAEEA